jgi:ketosteroid isomerase-like protein
VSSVFGWLAGRFSELRNYEFELIAAGASADLAYTVGLEHKTVVFDGRQETYTLRVTHVYRRESGVWKIVHRHGDRPPALDPSVPQQSCTPGNSMATRSVVEAS